MLPIMRRASTISEHFPFARLIVEPLRGQFGEDSNVNEQPRPGEKEDLVDKFGV